MPVDPRHVSATTIAHYADAADAFREGTRDHDVSQNIAALLRNIRGAAPFTILDLGCGPGRDLAAFTAFGHVAIGIEGAARLAEMARAATGCEVWEQDFLALHLPAARFDGIFANASLFHVPRRPPAGIHPTAVIAATAKIASPVSIGAYTVIGDDVEIGPDATIHPHVTIYPGVRIGAGFVAHAGVVVREDVRIGDRVVLHPGVVLGGDGFGFVPGPRGAVKILQTGTVIIEHDVEIGANTTIDRATLGATVVREGAKLDNLVMVGHNCEVGAHSFLAAQVGLAGSTKLGRGVQMGGQAGAAGHLTIGDGAQIVAQSGVPSSVAAGHTVGGYPAVEVTRWRRASAALLRLPELLQRVRRLERAAATITGRPRRRDDAADGE
jgi:UDP-3-O-[3-hydroxymyristoyl] glucosamine N-acyltransferase